MTTNSQHPSPNTQKSADDLLLEQFFQAARTEQLPDNGFTHRVMTRVAATDPMSASRLSWLWTAACIVVALIVFTLMGGWNIVMAGIVSVLTTMPTTSTQLIHLMTCGAILTALVVAELVRRERLTLS